MIHLQMACFAIQVEWSNLSSMLNPLKTECSMKDSIEYLTQTFQYMDTTIKVELFNLKQILS
nr:MAG TPA: hypothetical protein [Bacteriophage sp.]